MHLNDGEALPYDSLLLATGAASEPAFIGGGVSTWDDTSGVEALGGLLRDLEEGYSERLAIVIPPGPGWPLPAYELALLIAGDAQGMGMTPEIVLVTPEQAPLAIFGSRAVEVVGEELAHAGVRVELGACAELEAGPPRALVLRPSGRRMEVGRVLALPHLRGRAIDDVPCDADGFVSVDAHCRVVGADGVCGRGHRLGGRRGRRARAVPSRPPRAAAHRKRPALSPP